MAEHMRGETAGGHGVGVGYKRAADADAAGDADAGGPVTAGDGAGGGDVSGKTSPLAEIEYHNIAQAASGNIGLFTAIFCVVTCQLGSCIAYLVFVAVTLSGVVGQSTYVVILSLIPVTGGLSLLRSTKRLSFSSMLGNFALLLCIGSIVGYSCAQTPVFLPAEDYSWGFDVSGLAVFIGIALFGFSAHAESLSIVQSLAAPSSTGTDGDSGDAAAAQEAPGAPEDEAERLRDDGDLQRRRFRRCILVAVYVSVTVLYCVFGVVSYMFFGGKGRALVPAVILEAMTAKTPVLRTVTTVVKVAMSASLVVQVPIILFPTWAILEWPFEKLRRRFEAGSGAGNGDGDGDADRVGNGGHGGRGAEESAIELTGLRGATGIEGSGSSNAKGGSSAAHGTAESGACRSLCCGGPRLSKGRCNSIMWEVGRSVFRVAVVTLVSFAACAVGTDFKNICALVGSFSNGIVAFVMPPWFMLGLFGRKGLGMPEMCVNVVVLVLGIGCCGYSTALILDDMITGSQASPALLHNATFAHNRTTTHGHSHRIV